MIQRNKLILIVCLFFFSVYSALSLLHHSHYLSGGFDLGIFDQAIWRYAHFLSPYNTVKDKIILGDHLTLTLPLLAPLFWLWDDVRIILLFQAACIAFSALPIYLYLLKRNFAQHQAIMLSVIYLLFYGIQGLIYFDFHSVAIGVGLLAWVLYFWQTAKWRWFTVSIIVLFLTQENMGIALFCLCLIWFFQKKRRKLVLILAGVSVLYTLCAFFLLKFIAHGALEYTPQFPQTIGEWMGRFYDMPEKRDVWLLSFSSYSFLPLLSPGAVLAVIVDLAQYFTTGSAYHTMWSPYTHHRAILSIFLLVGSADVLLFLKKRKVNITIVLVGMLCVSLFLQWHFHFALNKLTKQDFLRTESWMQDNDAIIASLPASASIVTQQSLVPHLSHRETIFMLYPHKHIFPKDICPKRECWWLDFAGKPEYLLVDTHDNEWLTMTLVDIADFREAIHTMENARVITLTKRKNETKLYRIEYQRLTALKKFIK